MPRLQKLLEPLTAGWPGSAQKWLRCSLSNLKKQLAKLGSKVSKPTLAKLLKQKGYSLRGNHKEYEASASHPERNTQFEYLESQKYDFQQAGWPIISVDESLS
jgi:fructose-1-phosphate kinase PfkB-like protein